jgi:hypothetical protein
MARRKLKPTRDVSRFFDSQDKSYCVYEIHRRAKKTIYHNRGGERGTFPIITLDGFQGLPTGLFLNRRGFGFGRKGVFLLSLLARQFGQGTQMELVIANGASKSIRAVGKRTAVILPYSDVKGLLVRLGQINEENNNELRGAVASFLSTKFPTRIKIAPATFDDYQAGAIAEILQRKNVAKRLNEDDLERLNAFFPSIFAESAKGKRKGIKTGRASLLSSTKRMTDRIFLDEVISEFERNLKKSTLREQEWQKFLGEKAFRFMANYVTSIEKQNVSISVSYPDFVLVDVLGFVDVFEIKRHDTQLLAYDSSHENYYWRPEVAQAISQIENYIDEVVRNADEYTRAVKRKKKVNISVVRPRGFIVGGTRAQFATPKESEDFRKLGMSLKNISFILYDEILDRLKNIRQQLR